MNEPWVKTREEYARRVARGEGFVPGQKQDGAGQSAAEREFRAAMEKRKDEILARRVKVSHPVSINDRQIEHARDNMRLRPWARRWYDALLQKADHVVSQPDDYVERMIPLLTPTNPSGFTCPACVGTKTQVGMGYTILGWNPLNPFVISCRVCGQTYPDAKFPETGQLVCPRAGQTFTYFQNEDERRHPRDCSGRRSWHWAEKPAHPSYSGMVRERTVLYMFEAARALGMAYRFTGESRYAARAIEILVRTASCCRNWLYHDFYDSFADCDPLYAAWHFMELPLQWKRNPTSRAYSGATFETGPVDDRPKRAKMLATYFGSGRVTASADCWILEDLAQAYDLVHDAVDSAGRPLWTEESRRLVERDLIVEYLLGSEPFIGGPGKANETGNKAPYIYAPMAVTARCLGLPDYAHVALLGYEAIRNRAFLADGMSRESPAYTEMYLNRLIWVPEFLHGFRWPKGFKPIGDAGEQQRRGQVDLYKTDTALARIIRTHRETISPDGLIPPLSATPIEMSPKFHILEIGLKRYPKHYGGTLPTFYRAQIKAVHVISTRSPGPLPSMKAAHYQPTEYAVLNLRVGEIEHDTGHHPPETLYPDWQTAIMHHGRGPKAATLAMAFNPAGGHRHNDNLTLFYADGGQTILGDQGYVGDTLQIYWGDATQSHNLVVVDDVDQKFWPYWNAPTETPGSRQPSLRFMVSSPLISAVEAESKAYDQCSEYRRLTLLVKGPDGVTFAVDVFRVKGGKKHAYRLSSELAAGPGEFAKPGSGRRFVGLDLKPDPPMPYYGNSIERQDIFGFRDVRTVNQPGSAWQAIWEQPDRSYRLWMLSKADRVEASHGPGQELPIQAGRRIRYIDVINEAADGTGGAGLSSTFVAIHEPSSLRGAMPILDAQRLDLPADAGPNAVALRIRSRWGTYLVLSEFDKEVVVDGVRFGGTLGVVCLGKGGKQWLLSSGATALQSGKLGFAGAPAIWEGKMTGNPGTDRFKTSTPQPRGWPVAAKDVTNYVLIEKPWGYTGYPVASTGRNEIRVSQFPLPRAHRFIMPAVQFHKR